jgi:hypothetical protein
MPDVVLPVGMARSDIHEEMMRQGLLIDRLAADRLLEDTVGGREGIFSSDFNFIDSYAESIAKAVIASDTLNTNFAEGVKLAQNINIDMLPKAIANAVDLVAPSIRALGSFTEDELQRIGETGGVSLVKGLQPVFDLLTEGAFVPTVG